LSSTGIPLSALSIGVLGPAFSFENGGYRAHLHLGIEKSTHEKALVAGYNDNVSHWYDPVDFMTRKADLGG
jgi:hypothetical protein